MDKDVFSTKDLFLASTLAALDIYPDEVTKNIIDGRKIALFIYTKDIKKIEKTIKMYYDKELRIDPQILFYSMKQMKNRIYDN